MTKKKLGTRDTHTYSYEIDGMLDRVDYDLRDTAYDVTMIYDYDKTIFSPPQTPGAAIQPLGLRAMRPGGREALASGLTSLGGC